jgi:hypothetical protein
MKRSTIKHTVIGVGNIAFAIIGMLNIAFSIGRIVRGFRNFNTESAIITAFWVMTVINGMFIVMLAVSGLRLVRGSNTATTLANATYIVEITYFLCIGILWSSPASLSDAIAGATGGGNMGIAPQVMTLFPVIALFVLNVRFRCKAPQVVGDRPVQ